MLGRAPTLAAWSPAAARRDEAVTELEQRIVTTTGHEQRVGLRTPLRETLAIERAAAGTLPGESWGGASSGFGRAREKPGNVRLLAQDGDEDACLVLVDEARIIVQGLRP